MVKRFTDTDKWKKKWFRQLASSEKIFWFYILDACTYAGIWEVDFELAEFFCGSLDEKKIREVFADHYVELKKGRYWYILDYISFQYGSLSLSCKPHQPVIKSLKKFGLFDVYSKGLDTLKEKETNKKENKEKIDFSSDPALQDFYKKLFEELWGKYPKKVGKKQAWHNFLLSFGSKDQEADIRAALDNYLKFLKKENHVHNWRAAQDGKTWFKNWREWSTGSFCADTRKPLICTFCGNESFVEDTEVIHKEVSKGEVVIQYKCKACA